MTNYRKKLIEVGLPLVAINAESAREKSIRHGHPSTLHLWWARRPLAACRAVLFASLVDDPDSDPQYRNSDGTVDEDTAGIKRADLFNLIEELVAWENSNNVDVIRSARAEIARCVASRLIETGKLQKQKVIGEGVTAQDIVVRCHSRSTAMGLDKKAGRVRFSFDTSRLPPPGIIDSFLADYAPPALDPFAGGGSIPLEAQRLGLRAYATDLNPIPVLINKALIEIPPCFAGHSPINPESSGEGISGKGKKLRSLLDAEWRGAAGLAADVRYYGKWVREQAENRIGHLYPKVTITEELIQDRADLRPHLGKELTVLAWLWARTVASPDPSCNGAHVPIIKSLCISNRAKESVWLEPSVNRKDNTYRFHIRQGQPAPSVTGYVNRRGVTCLLSGTPIPFDYVRTEGKAGRIKTRLFAMIVETAAGRIYLPAVESHSLPDTAFSLDWMPDTEMASNPFSLRPPLYGFLRYSDLYSRRQLAALDTLSTLLISLRERLIGEGRPVPYADAIVTYLAFAVSKCADYWNAVATWMPRGTVGHAFSKQALPMTWDYPEANPFADFHCAWHEAVEWVAKVVDTWILSTAPGHSRQANATQPFPDGQSFLISTDPPYYNNIDYADLSDFFYVWLRRSLSGVYPSLFQTIATPKESELVASPYRFNGEMSAARDFFETGLEEAFRQIRRSQVDGYPVTVFYAFKQTESDDDSDSETSSDDDLVASTGWETMLEGLMKSGFLICGTWPMRTERSARTMSIGMNALASSIVLVCRPRPSDATLATRKEFITSLRRELPESLRNLQRGNIAPVDLAQAAIGPGMAVFTRYAKVLESDGSPMSVRTALGLINQTLDEVLAEQEGEFDGDTRWALSWFEQYGMEDGPFGDAETLSKAKNTAINGLVEAGIVAARSGKVRLVRRDELSESWNPATDTRLTVWEVTQHLIRRLDQKGEMGASDLVRQLGGIAETARDLAYRLYSTCERKKWAEEAMAYNGLVIVWPELTKLAQAARTSTPSAQRDLF